MIKRLATESGPAGKDRQRNQSFGSGMRSGEKSGDDADAESFVKDEDSYEFEIHEKEQYENHAK